MIRWSSHINTFDEMSCRHYIFRHNDAYHRDLDAAMPLSFYAHTYYAAYAVLSAFLLIFFL